MAIPMTAVQKRRLITQIENNLTGLQRDMRANAIRHKQMAMAQDPAIGVLAQYVTDAALAYLARLQWIINLRNDAVRRQRLVDMLASAGWTEQEIVDYVTALRNVAVSLRDASKSTYEQVISACDAVVAAVNPVESLWPE